MTGVAQTLLSVLLPARVRIKHRQECLCHTTTEQFNTPE